MLGAQIAYPSLPNCQGSRRDRGEEMAIARDTEGQKVVRLTLPSVRAGPWV